MRRNGPSVCVDALAVFSAAVVVYVNTFAAEFVYDDSRAIVTNADVMGDGSWKELLLHDYWGNALTHSGSHKSYRPLTTATFRLNYIFAALHARWYHVTNVLLHGCACVLMWLVAGRLTCLDRRSRLFASLLFAVHPIHTEAVAGVVGRADILTSVFFLLGLLSFGVHLDARTTTKATLTLTLTTTCAALALVSKEQGLTLLPICLLFDWCRRGLAQLPIKTSRMRLWCTWLTLLSSCFWLALWRLWMIEWEPPDFSPADNPVAHDSSLITRTLTLLYLPLFHLRLLLLPDLLSFDWSMAAIPLISSPLDRRAIFLFLFYSLVIYCSLRIIKSLIRDNSMGEMEGTLDRRSPSPKLDQNANIRGKKMKRCSNNGQCWTPTSAELQSARMFTFERVEPVESLNQVDRTDRTDLCLAILLIVIPFLPASNLLTYVGFVVAERVLYLPSVGFCLLLAMAIRSLVERVAANDRRTKRSILGCSVVLLIVFAGRTVRRNRDWLTEEALYTSGIHVNPAKAYSNLGNVFARQQRWSKAEEAYGKALTLRPNMADTHYNLGVLLQEQKQYETASESYRLALIYRPQLAAAHLNLGLCLWTLGLLTESEQQFVACARLDSEGLKNPKAQLEAMTSCSYNRGRLLAEQGKLAEAVDAYKKALDMRPVDYHSTASLFNMLGEALAKMYKLQEAEEAFTTALRHKPRHVPAHLTMGHLRWKQGKNSEALSWFTRAVELDRTDGAAGWHLAQFLERTGRLSDALDVYQNVLTLSPSTNDDVRTALANVYRQLGRLDDAEREYRLVAEDKKTDGGALANYAAILHLNGKHGLAENMYLQALRFQPHVQITKDNLKKLRRIMAKTK